MANLKIKYEDGKTRVWLNDNEIENVQECNFDMDAKRTPITTLKIVTMNVDIDTIIREESINLDKYEVKRNGKSVNEIFNTAFDKAYAKKNN